MLILWIHGIILELTWESYNLCELSLLSCFINSCSLSNYLLRNDICKFLETDIRHNALAFWIFCKSWNLVWTINFDHFLMPFIQLYVISFIDSSQAKIPSHLKISIYSKAWRLLVFFLQAGVSHPSTQVSLHSLLSFSCCLLWPPSFWLFSLDISWTDAQKVLLLSDMETSEWFSLLSVSLTQMYNKKNKAISVSCLVFKFNGIFL